MDHHSSFLSGGDEEGPNQLSAAAANMDFMEQQRRAAMIQAAQERKCNG